MDPIRPELAAFARAAALVAGIVLAASGCFAGEARIASAAPPDMQHRDTEQAGVTDSILPMDLLLARFREGMPPVTLLAGGETSADRLVFRFMSAVERGDTAMLARLHVSRDEYAWLYFPTSAYAAPPYELPPNVAWMLSAAASEKGLARVVRRLRGGPLNVRSYHCGKESREGANRFLSQCVVEYEDQHEGPAARRLFGTIIERDGHYKFLSYANDF